MLTSGPRGQRGLGGHWADHVGHVSQNGLTLGDSEHLTFSFSSVAHVNLGVVVTILYSF